MYALYLPKIKKYNFNEIFWNKIEGNIFFRMLFGLEVSNVETFTCEKVTNNYLLCILGVTSGRIFCAFFCPKRFGTITETCPARIRFERKYVGQENYTSKRRREEHPE